MCWARLIDRTIADMIPKSQRYTVISHRWNLLLTYATHGIGYLPLAGYRKLFQAVTKSSFMEFQYSHFVKQEGG